MTSHDTLDASFLSPAGPAAGPNPADVARVFEILKKCIKTLNFNRHRPDEYRSYLETGHRALDELLRRQGHIDIKLEVSTLLVNNVPVLEDDQRENNLVFPLWNEGVRLLTFREGLTLDELLKFLSVLINLTPVPQSEDLLSVLWKAELTHIEWVALSDFSIAEGDAGDDVEVEVEEVLRYLQTSLAGDESGGVGYGAGKVALTDLELQLDNVAVERNAAVAAAVLSEDELGRFQDELAADEDSLLEKICSVIFEVMELEATDDELNDISAALEQLLDGLVLKGRFGAITRVIQFAEHLSSRPDASMANRDLGRRVEERMRMLIQQPERVRGVATALNAGRVSHLDDLQNYLSLLGVTATVVLLELLDTLHNPLHRRAVADVLIDAGVPAVPIFANRLQKASSNLAKDLFYIIDRINPPTKMDILKPILNHENAVLRVEVLNTLANTKNAKTFGLLRNVFEGHKVPQMRSHAARLMAQFPPELVAPYLLAVVGMATFDEQPPGIKRAVVGALAQAEHPEAEAWMRSIFNEKSSLLAKRRVDERKLLVIRGLATVPGIPALQLLSEIMQQTGMHSKEVLGAAREAAVKMRTIVSGKGA